jgi:succinate dehydrogenase / fumarate reductase cytochrome b subunit
MVRPVSPYMPYVMSMMRMQSLHTMGLSFLHRITGVALSLGWVLFVYWLVALMRGAQAYAQAQALLKSPWIQVLLVGWIFSFSYHFLNGIRHLAWDIGLGFDPKIARVTGYAVLVSAMLATGAIYLGNPCSILRLP